MIRDRFPLVHRVRDGSSVTERSEQDYVLLRPELVRQVLDRHTTAGENRAAMMRDLRQGGDDVGGRSRAAGSGKSVGVLGVAREVFELAG